MRCILFLLLVLFLTGCALDPDYDQPPLDAPEDWRLIDHDSRDLSDCGRRDPGGLVPTAAFSSREQP